MTIYSFTDANGVEHIITDKEKPFVDACNKALFDHDSRVAESARNYNAERVKAQSKLRLLHELAMAVYNQLSEPMRTRFIALEKEDHEKRLQAEWSSGYGA